METLKYAGWIPCLGHSPIRPIRLLASPDTARDRSAFPLVVTLESSKVGRNQISPNSYLFNAQLIASISPLRLVDIQSPACYVPKAVRYETSRQADKQTLHPTLPLSQGTTNCVLTDRPTAGAASVTYNEFD